MNNNRVIGLDLFRIVIDLLLSRCRGAICTPTSRQGV